MMAKQENYYNLSIKKQKEALYKWFIKTYQTEGIGYDEAIEILISYKESDNKSESSLYDCFVYMDDENWNEVESKVRQ